MRLFLYIALTLLAASAFCQQWKLIAPMNTPRSSFGIVTLGSGKFFVGGGYNSGGVISDCEKYDPISNTWSPSSSMNQSRHAYPLLTLQNGNLFAPSGLITYINDMTSSCELYDTATDTWRYTTPVQNVREGADAIVMPNGKVLMAGGGDAPLYYIRSCEIYDPVTASMTYTDSIQSIQFANGLFYYQPRNSIVMMSGHSRYAAHSETEEYDIATGKWKVVANSATPHSCWQQQSLQMPDGRIIAVSGANGEKALSDLVEEFNPATNTWRTVCRLPIPRALGTTVHITGDTILIIGGVDFDYIGMRNTTFIDLKNGTTWDGPQLNEGRGFHRAVTVRTTDSEDLCKEYVTVYVFGGYTNYPNSLASCESITFTATKQVALGLPESLTLVGSRCAGIDTGITINNTSCRAISIDSVVAVGLHGTSITAALGILGSSDSNTIHIINTNKDSSTHSGIILVYYTSNGRQVSQSIPITITTSGSGVDLRMPASLSASGSVCDGIDTSLTITNASCDALIVDSLVLNGLFGASSRTQLPISIPSGGSITISLGFHDYTPGVTNGTVELYLHTTDTSFVRRIPLSVDIKASIRGAIRSVIGDMFDVGDQFELPIYLNSNTGEGISGVELTLEYNTDLIHPLAPIFDGTLTEGTGLYDQNVTPTGLSLYIPTRFTLSSAQPLVTLRFLSYVTDTNCTLLRLKGMRFDPDNPTAQFCEYQIISDSAVICRSNECGDGLLREQLRHAPLRFTGIAYRYQKNVICINHSEIATPTTIRLYDELGRLISQRQPSQFSKTSFIDASSLSDGIYFVTMTSATSFARTKLLLLK